MLQESFRDASRKIDECYNKFLKVRKQTKAGFQEPERNQEVLKSSKTVTETKPGSSNFERREPKPKTKPVNLD